MAWKLVELSSVAQLVKRQERVDPTREYRQAGVRLWGAGAYERETVTGDQTKYANFTRLKINDIIVNKIWARNGSASVIGSELDGCYCSPEYPIYEIDQDVLLPRFFFWFTKSKMLWDQCDALSRGTSGQNRLKPNSFLRVLIPLPPLNEQRSVAQRLDHVQARLSERQAKLDAVELEAAALLFKVFQGVVDGVECRPLSEVAPLMRRPVEVKLGGDYLELGVRSFGKGTFHKPTLSGADVGSKRLFEIHQGDLLFNIVFAWEGAIAVPGPDDHKRVGSHRFLTCVPNPEIATAEFLRYYLLTPEGLRKVGEASPGGAGRNRTLGIKKAEQIHVPVPPIDLQRQFDKLRASIASIRAIRASSSKDAEALIPSILHELFEKQSVELKPLVVSPETNVVPLEKAHGKKGSERFREAILVGAIVKAFHADGGQPLGNFRLQKAVYFARRHLGEHTLDEEYLRKAAGPYNPSMRYSGGIKIAADKKWIERAKKGKWDGSVLGDGAADMDEWIERYQFAATAAWVRDKFKYKKNPLWELLATVDYAMLALENTGTHVTPEAILAYIENDEEWRPKVKKLDLSVASIQSAMNEVRELFDSANSSASE